MFVNARSKNNPLKCALIVSSFAQIAAMMSEVYLLKGDRRSFITVAHFPFFSNGYVSISQVRVISARARIQGCSSNVAGQCYSAIFLFSTHAIIVSVELFAAFVFWQGEIISLGISVVLCTLLPDVDFLSLQRENARTKFAKQPTQRKDSWISGVLGLSPGYKDFGFYEGESENFLFDTWH